MSLSAVLLAGGESQRMKRDKATIPFRERPLWRHQLDLLRKLEPQEIFVSAQSDPEWRPADVKFVADALPARGPLSGISATFSRTTSNHLLVIGIDMPFINPEYLRKLLRKVRPGRGVVPMIEDRAEPLAAIYPRNADVDFSAALSGKNFSLQPLVAKLIASGKLEAVPVSDAERALFRNLNEPGDLVPN